MKRGLGITLDYDYEGIHAWLLSTTPDIWDLVVFENGRYLFTYFQQRTSQGLEIPHFWTPKFVYTTRTTICNLHTASFENLHNSPLHSDVSLHHSTPAPTPTPQSRHFPLPPKSKIQKSPVSEGRNLRQFP